MKFVLQELKRFHEVRPLLDIKIYKIFNSVYDRIQNYYWWKRRHRKDIFDANIEQRRSLLPSNQLITDVHLQNTLE